MSRSRQTAPLLLACLSPSPESALDAQNANGALIRLAVAEAGTPLSRSRGPRESHRYADGHDLRIELQRQRRRLETPARARCAHLAGQ